MPPDFSIIIPTLNEAKFLPLLLTDLSLQTHFNFETIIVDASSTDSTTTLAKSFHHLKPRIIISPKKNVSIQRNLGAAQALAPWLIFADADNRLPSFFLSAINQQLQNQPLDCFTTTYHPDNPKHKYRLLFGLINAGMKFSHRLNHPESFGAMIGVKRQVFHQTPGFNPQTSYREDTQFVRLLVSSGYTFHILPYPVTILSCRRYDHQGLLPALNTFLYAYLREKTLGFPTKPLSQYPMTGGQDY